LETLSHLALLLLPEEINRQTKSCVIMNRFPSLPDEPRLTDNPRVILTMNDDLSKKQMEITKGMCGQHLIKLS